ncbi:MAG: CPBP family glutamic-type intramembrane protease, partial [Myxococcota bacterium]
MSLSITFVAMFYSLMAALGWALAAYWGGFDPFEWGEADEVSRLMQVGVGVSVGVVTVLISQALEHLAQWARRMSEGFREMLGQQSLASITVIAFFSGIGEEVFFRGFLQQMLAVH